jgi:DNA-binding NtrC family response regulator
MVSAHKKSVLIAVSEEGLREALSGILEDEDLNVVTVSSGKEAMGVLSSTLPDMVLLDDQYPDTDGKSVLRNVKKLHADLPVIILSYGVPQEDPEWSNMGTVFFLEKPVSVEKLLLAINKIIAGKND